MIDECVGLIQLDKQERERLSHIDGATLDRGFFFPRENRESFVLRVLPHRERLVRALRIHVLRNAEVVLAKRIFKVWENPSNVQLTFKREDARVIGEKDRFISSREKYWISSQIS